MWSSTVPEIKPYNTTIQIKDDLDLLIVRSEDNGKTWTNPQKLHNNADTDSGNDTNPCIATDTKKGLSYGSLMRMVGQGMIVT